MYVSVKLAHIITEAQFTLVVLEEREIESTEKFRDSDPRPSDH